MTATPEFFALQEEVAGRYSLVRELGRGGMGIVFLARDVALDRPVAIKMLPPELAASRAHRERFVREARTAARLSHPHIVAIHAVEERPTAVYFVMAFVDGDTLASRVAREGPLPAAEAMRIVQEVAWALGHAHANGVVHRDVKPDNILLERGSGRAVVTDFGIARAADSPDTSAEGRVIGTPRYMSPEQAAGEAVDARSDMYSLGAVAYFAVSGQPPYDGQSAAAIMAKHLTAPAPAVANLVPTIPPVFAAAIDRCLGKRPEERYGSADELAAALRSVDLVATLDIAPPVRLFLREIEAAGSEILTVGTLSTLSLAGFLYTYLKPETGFLAGITETLLYLGVSASMITLTVLRASRLLGHARELLRAGYGHSAVRPALLLEQEAHQREFPLSRVRSVSHLGFAAAWVGSFLLFNTETFIPAILGFAGMVAVPAIYAHRLTRKAYGSTSWLARAMKGRFGKLLFRLAGVGLREQRRMTPAIGEPTAVAIGQAIQDLYAGLPEQLRCQVPDVPALVERLEAEAMAKRLQTPRPAEDGGFVTAVAMLETLRLDLLRLHASGNLEDFTRHLEAARRAGQDIAIQSDARREVSRSFG